MIAPRARFPVPIPGGAPGSLPPRACVWVFPYPPKSLNNLFPTGTTKTGKHYRFLDSRCAKWKQDVGVLVLDSRWKAPPGPLGLSLRAYPPDAVRRDASNLVKLAEDAICEALGLDDYRIVHVEVWRHPSDKANPRIEATLTPVLGLEKE